MKEGLTLTPLSLPICWVAIAMGQGGAPTPPSLSGLMENQNLIAVNLGEGRPEDLVFRPALPSFLVWPTPWVPSLA